MKSAKILFSLWLVALGILFIIDRSSKFWASQILPSAGLVSPWGGGFKLEQNPGIAFGLRLPMVLIYSSSLIILGICIYLTLRALRQQSWLELWGLGLIVIGAVSNLLDRISGGKIIDFIHLPYWSIFNLSDAFIVVGAGLFALSKFLFDARKIKVIN